MPVFLVERQFADQVDLSVDDVRRISDANDDSEVRWLSSFLSADKRKTFCLYEADDVDAIRTAASRAGVPAVAIVALSGTLAPDGSFSPI